MRPRPSLLMPVLIGFAWLTSPIPLQGQVLPGTVGGVETPSVPSEPMPAIGSSPAPGTRSIILKPPVEPLVKGKRWAIVVGIRYTKEERAEWKDRGSIPVLSNAENDATDFASVLKKQYGYPEDSIFLLRGKQATRDAIANLLLEGLVCDGKKVGPDDSVLFYFSGHGVGPEPGTAADQEHAYLLPCDAEVNDQGRPNTTFAIDIGDIAAKLRSVSHCKARHILLILDCCHSGAVFQMQGTSGGAFEHSAVDDSLLGTRSVQAIAASRSTQRASDGTTNDRNSPFTGSLLRAMQEVPPTLPRERFYYTTNQLFYAMKAYVNAVTSVEQTPQCRWLDGLNAGEFTFHPDPNARFDEISDESRRLLLTMVPSTFGNWWGEEMPWFMPGLRLEILENRSETRSTLADEVDKTKLRKAALLTLSRLQSDPTIDSARRRRVGHLRIMLDAEESADRKQRYRKVIDELKAATASAASDGKPPFKGRPEAVDVHQLAVLQHVVGDLASARTSYELALDLYAEESKHFIRFQALEALCHSDYGMLLEDLSDNDNAYDQFVTARGLFGLGAPIPFRIFCLTKEADARRAKGFYGASDSNMDRAVALANSSRFDPDETHPVTAAAYKHYAWAKMQQWEFDQAEVYFKKTQEILSKKANLDRPECQVDQLHAKHGLAMIHRFQGADEEAIKAYAALTREISDEIRRLERRTETDLNLAEIRALLYDRLVNSLERQADCYLFGRRPDFEAAAYYYRRGLQLVDQVPENRKVVIKCDLLYRQAIALLLQSFDIDTPAPIEKDDPASSLLLGEGRPRSEAESAESARASSREQVRRAYLRKQARRILDQASTLDLASDVPPISIQLVQAIAQSLCRTADSSSPAAASTSAQEASRDRSPSPKDRDHSRLELEDLLDTLGDSKRDFNRDELERLMFAYRLLIQQKEGKLDDLKRLDLAEGLHEHCRSALRLANADPGVIAYLRPYFDAIFRVKVRYQPVGMKDLIELIWEATTGDLNPPPVANQPILAMYFLDNRCHLVLDVPHGRSGRYEIDPEELPSVDYLKQAVTSGRVLSCPDGLRKGLRSIRLAEGQSLLVHYQDPFHRLNHVVLKPPSDRIPNPAGVSYVFPFDIRSALADPSYPIGTIRPPETPQPAEPATSEEPATRVRKASQRARRP